MALSQRAPVILFQPSSLGPEKTSMVWAPFSNQHNVEAPWPATDGRRIRKHAYPLPNGDDQLREGVGHLRPLESSWLGKRGVDRQELDFDVVLQPSNDTVSSVVNLREPL